MKAEGNYLTPEQKAVGENSPLPGSAMPSFAASMTLTRRWKRGGGMSQLPYFPLYPTDFEADTSHLTLEEDGAYNRLLRLMDDARVQPAR